MAQSKHWKDRGYDILNNIYATPLAGLLVMIGSGLYTHYGADWAKPIVNAIISGITVLCLGVLLTCLAGFPFGF